MTTFARPYFVTPHAVKRFQQRIANIPAADIINLIQTWMQGNPDPVDWQEWRGELCPVYRFKYEKKHVYIPIRSGEKEWPAVPTILGPESRLHKQVTQNINLNYSIADIAYMLDVDRSTVSYWIKNGFLVCRKKGCRYQASKISHSALIHFMRKYPDKWNAAKLQVDVFGWLYIPRWFKNKLSKDSPVKMAEKTWRDYEVHILRNNYKGDAEEMAKLLNRSPASILVKACRLRKEGLM